MEILTFQHRAWTLIQDVTYSTSVTSISIGQNSFAGSTVTSVVSVSLKSCCFAKTFAG